MDINTQLLLGESETQYLWRLGNLKDSGAIDLGWREIADLINHAFKDETEYVSESAYRKKYSAAKLFRDEVFNKNEPNDLQETKRELIKLKQQLRDERIGLNSKLRNEARLEQDLDYLKDKLQEIGKVHFDVAHYPVFNTTDKSMIVILSDAHIGQCFDSYFGAYNSDIAKERLNKYLNRAIEIGKQNSVEHVYVALLGDEISGNNHLSIQVSNRENLIDQVKTASEYIASFCVSLSEVFNAVDVYGIAGNHSRCVADKDKDIKDERLDLLITWIVKQITAHIKNINVHDNNLDSSFTKMTVCDKDYILTHGDMTSTSDSDISKLVLALGEFPYAILCGHKHSPMYKECNNIRVVQSGSLASAGDDFTVSKRLTGKANQTILIVDKDGIQSINNIELS